jgi:L-methionine (R)-S-oxide reductase
MATDPLVRLARRYERIAVQLEELFAKNRDPIARMATTVAVLHHKMNHFFWTGFYRLVDEDLKVGPYQGPLACSILERHKGVCWTGIDKNEAILVADVDAFEGHIACDSRSKSELVVPMHNAAGELVGVLDVDAKKPDAFSQVDLDGLTRIVELIYC